MPKYFAMSKILYFSSVFILAAVVGSVAGEPYNRCGDTTPSFCYLEPETGKCRGSITRFYYDPNEGCCKEFMYGGCGGNENNFNTQYACMTTCMENNN